MDPKKGIISWFARNSVAANLLMICILVGGLLTAMTINKKIFPSFELNIISINVAYPGAAPQEIEEGINIKIEEAIKEVEGIKEVTTIAAEGAGRVQIEVETSYDADKVLDEVKLLIDAISTFPQSIEKPNIYRVKPQENILYVSVYGDLALHEMKELAKDIREEITNLPGVTRADVIGVPQYEIAIEVTEFKLQEYGLTFAQVAQAVQRSSIDLPGGSIKAHDGNILLRTKGQAYTGTEFSNIVVKTNADGSRVYLDDIASINDGFTEGLNYTRFNGQEVVMVEVFSVGDQSSLNISEQVNRYIDEKKLELPTQIKLDIWGNIAYYLQGRLDLMLSNMFSGALLVFLILALFMRIRLAFWVMMGLPVCFLGTLLFMPTGMFGLSINMITLFAFIMVLGIVVDDAIVIGESAYSEIEKNGQSLDNVVTGAQRVAMPATFGVLTTIAAFIPMVLVEGPMSAFTESIGYVVILCLLFSLVESKLILPSHLANMKVPKPGHKANVLERFRGKFDKGLKYFIKNLYRPTLQRAIHFRYSVLAGFIGLLFVCGSLLGGGLVRWVFFPDIPSDFIQVNIDMTESTAEETTKATAQKIENALYKTNQQLLSVYGDDVVQHSFVSMNSQTNIFIFAELKKGEDREINGVEIADAWRDNIPELPGVKKLTMNASTGVGGGDPIAFKLTGKNLESLNAATKELKATLSEYEGLVDIADSASSGRQEIKLAIKPSAEALGISLSDLAQQVRWSFYGFEAQRILRGTEEIKVMVRYPLEDRRTIGHLEQMRIRTSNGTEVPFSSVATIELGEGLSNITRVDGKRSVTVTANVNKDKVEPGKVTRDIEKEYIPKLLNKYPDVSSELSGEAKEEGEAVWGLAKGAFFALFAIYALMAIPLKSYSQPIIIMSVIPFGVIGAIFGHFIMGLSLSLLSLFGIVALIGVVVNDSLVMVDYVNQARAAGHSIKESVVDAGCSRFRAIILTSLTTFFGLIPIMSETSLQAQILIPMAASIAFGILFSTVITLFLVPSLYVIGSDMRRHMRRFTNIYRDNPKPLQS
ncbi:efflux RND transporter permease subunit [Psychrobium sp. 1_MG-2023]|uniref:efflux RND transporter permease subunit n=1 Tax=Psychrobium sp. 1_MG-2023 TaxID=3062624 RepID=UPI000C32A624|nr:efflux RND transporter permease subunit [Psychrobium sp. 1_MG-2023]MDP2560055.1 efflux RND transporter permease subunit [Psychrobium sp. 1_MG-2023]PKF56284.1 acriflavin resistance protein [Alteromonadales bacterium alter-6D02]